MPEPESYTPLRSVRLSDEDWARLDAIARHHGLGSRTEAIRHLIARAAGEDGAAARYEALMQAQGRELRRLFGLPELVVVANACRGWLVTPADAGLVWMEVEDYLAAGPAWDALQDALAPDRWPALVEKLRGLTDVQAHALACAVGRVLDGGSWEQALGGVVRGGSRAN